MKTVLIADDEDDARDLLRFYISQHAAFTLIGEATNGIEAVQLINQLKPDTVFLDIQMPGLNGFEVLTQLDEIPEIIFSTAFDHYAIKAFEVHAIDYLLKPYGKSRFENALSRIIKSQENIIPLAEKLLSSETVFPNKIILHKGARKIMVNVDQILYGEAYGDYTRIFTQKEELLSTRGISFLLDNLDKNIFIRLHRSHFANKQYIKEIIKIERYTYAVLAGDVKIKISESFLPDIRKIMF